MGAGFGSEVVANLSSGWIFTSWRVWIYLGTPVSSVVFQKTINPNFIASGSIEMDDERCLLDSRRLAARIS